MAEELNLADIQQQYHKNIVLFKDRPVFVQSVEGRQEVVIRYLDNLKDDVVPFSLDTFKAHKGRLGMVNYKNTAAYMSRVPVRKMGIGLNAGNVNFATIEELHCLGPLTVVKELGVLCKKEIGLVITGGYPSFADAFEEVMNVDEGCTIRAFDRQFAVSSSKSIYYKAQLVGTVAKNAKTVKNIKFREGYEYLEQLL